jgi:uncharacterized membrane protein
MHRVRIPQPAGFEMSCSLPRKEFTGFVKEPRPSGSIAWLPWILILIGIALRLAQYLANRSLWLDESFLALNILHRSLRQLLEPLNYGQATPLAFLMVEKLITQIFGSSEFAFRFFPFLCGIVSLFLFSNVSKRLLCSRGALLALTLFAVSWPLVYYSSELKQYSSDVTIALLLYSLALYVLQQDRPGTFSFALFGVTGSIALWFSHPAFFVLAGIAVGLVVHRTKHPQWASLTTLLLVFSIWAVSFLLLYSISLVHLSSDQSLANYWASSFMPFPPRSLLDIQWFFSTFFAIFESPVGLPLSGLAALGFVIGCRSMFLTVKFIILVLPIILTLLASGFHKYPFSGRLLLFLVPSLLILIAEGASYIREKTLERDKIIGITFIVLLLLMPHLLAAKRFVNPVFVEEIRPVINYIRTARHTGDVIYLHHNAYYAFEYYLERFGFPDNSYIRGASSEGNRQGYIEDLDNLRGHKRVWILFSHVSRGESVDEEQLFLFYLDRIGRRLDSHKEIGASVYLYDLS